MNSSAPALDCYAIVTPGLEPFAIAEARALGLPVQAEEGGFAWTGDARSVMLANAALRIPSRVVVRLAVFDARSFAELERRARKVEWGRVLRDGDLVRFRVTSRKSKLYHTGGIAQRLADAVKRALPRVRTETAGDEEQDDAAAQLIIVRFVRDHAVISADTSGELLHRRGYRQATAKAPLRETIAAAMIQAGSWRADAPLLDPFCGSGTIPIEAAMLACGVAPGADRRFAIERWPGMASSLGASVRAELLAAERRDVVLGIEGSDRDAGAILASKANAERAGMSAAISFAERSISAAEFPAERGWVVSNPPYGVRVGDTDQVRDLWGRFGRVLRERAMGWQVVLLSPDPALDRQLGFPVQTVATTSNGGIPVRIIRGMVD